MNQNHLTGKCIDEAGVRLNVNPSDTVDVIGEYAYADVEQTLEAIDAAAVVQHDWAHSGIQIRADALDLIGSEIIQRPQELGSSLSREEDKNLREGIAEFTRAGQIFKFPGAEALRQRGNKLSSIRPDIEVEIVREPVGVVGIITSWNFSIAYRHGG